MIVGAGVGMFSYSIFCVVVALFSWERRVVLIQIKAEIFSVMMT